MTELQKKFMQAAINLAYENVKSGNGGPFGAVIVKNNKIIASGANMVTSSNDPTAHAEVVAIRNACKVLGSFQLDGCEIYSSCEPCPMCLGAIYWARPQKIFFACDKNDAAKANFDDSFIYQEINVSLSERKIPTFQMLRSEGLKVFSAWTKKDDKVEY
ncbi:MAG: nucleoside deaminase [Bacteroidales bacterium]|nr:nucleoside deaminase [Bacteroidales bacterium]